MRRQRDPAGKAVLDIDLVVEETRCCRADFGHRVDLLADQRVHQAGRKRSFLLGAQRPFGTVDANEWHS